MFEKPLGRVLVDYGYITNYQLSEALVKQKQNPALKLGDILIELGYISCESLNEALKKQLDIFRTPKESGAVPKAAVKEGKINVDDKKLSALIRLLIEKKLLTEEEYLKELRGD